MLVPDAACRSPAPMLRPAAQRQSPSIFSGGGDSRSFRSVLMISPIDLLAIRLSPLQVVLCLV